MGGLGGPKCLSAQRIGDTTLVEREKVGVSFGLTFL